MGVCSSFSCSKNALIALNILYIIIGILMIVLAAGARVAAMVTNVQAMAGLITCGVLLILLAIVGLIGAAKHHQVFLFFYMLILFFLFISQFIISIVLLFLNQHQQEEMIVAGWDSVEEKFQLEAQDYFNCCTLDGVPSFTTNTTNITCPSTCSVPCYTSTNVTNVINCCKPCLDVISLDLSVYIKHAAGICLFFSLTEIFGVWMTKRYRNQKDPKITSSAFL